VRPVGRLGQLAVAASVLIATGCATARYVVVEPGGGAVAIPRDTPENREKAAALMAQRCPGGYEILREEEVVTGSEVTKETSTEFDRKATEARTTERVSSRTRTEWRISFRCTAPR